MMLLVQLLLNGLINASIFSLLAVGFGILYRSLGFFHMSYGAIYTIASYAMFSAAESLGFGRPLALVFGIFVSCLVGEVMNRAVFFPLEKREGRSGVLLVASLGIYIVTVGSVALFFGNEIKIVSKGIEPSLSFGNIAITRIQAIQLAVGSSIISLFWVAIKRNTLVKALWAMGEAPMLVSVLGLPYGLMRTMGFVLSSFFAGIASVLVTLDIGTVPYSGMQALLIGAVAVIVGGTATFWGWVGGACLLALLQSLALWQFSAKWSDLVTFSILVLTLLFRPHGLFASKRRREER